jgi:hypothetical protein
VGEGEIKDPGEDRLLPGEATSIHSGNATDARVWVRVYAELSGFKDVLLAQVDEQRRAVEHPGQPEVENDKRLLEREADRLRRRLEFWQDELERRETKAC